MIEITRSPISPELIIAKTKTPASGCVVTYVGLIRDRSAGKPVLSVEYEDPIGNAREILANIAGEMRQKWQLESLAICHRIGKLNVGDINFVVAVASAHRSEGFAACQYAVDRFKQLLPTRKIETYLDRSTHVEGE